MPYQMLDWGLSLAVSARTPDTDEDCTMENAGDARPGRGILDEVHVRDEKLRDLGERHGNAKVEISRFQENQKASRRPFLIDSAGVQKFSDEEVVRGYAILRQKSSVDSPQQSLGFREGRLLTSV